MAQKHRRLLTELARLVVGGFPDHLFGELPEAELRRIAQEVFAAVESEAKAHRAALVLNLPTFAAAAAPEAASAGAPEAPTDFLDRWNIRRLQDLEALIQQASGPSDLPFGKPLPPPPEVCGGYFERITDPAHLSTLVEEYFDARLVFARPFANLGARRRILKGSVAFDERDVTIGALSRIFDLYKTRPLEREVILSLLRRRLGWHQPRAPTP